MYTLKRFCYMTCPHGRNAKSQSKEYLHNIFRLPDLNNFLPKTCARHLELNCRSKKFIVEVDLARTNEIVHDLTGVSP